MRSRVRLAVGICCSAGFLGGLDNTIVLVALPSIRNELHASFAAAQWTVDVYQLVLGAFLLMSGSIADRWGRRRTLQIGLAVFAGASLLCSVAPTVEWLIVFRALQALGASMLSPVALALIAHLCPEPARRGRAFGVWSSTYGLSMAVGPLLGGYLVHAVGWRSVFWTAVPIAVLAIGACALFVPESRSARPRRADPVAQCLVVVVLLAVVLAITEIPSWGWSSPLIWVLLGAGSGGAALLIRWELRRADPLLDPRFFRSIPFSGGIVMALTGMAAAAGYLWVITFYLQDARLLGPIATGGVLAPMALTVLAVAPLAGGIAVRHGPRLPLLVSGAATTGAALVLTQLDGKTPLWPVLSALILLGVGFGMLNAPLTSVVISGMPAEQAGVASAVASTGRQVGQALGVAVIGAIVIPGIDGRAVGRSLPGAIQPAGWVIAGAGLIVLLLAVLTTGGRARGAE